MSSYEEDKLREKFSEVLDPNYPDRDMILDMFAARVHESQSAMNLLQEEFEHVYRGSKDPQEEFKVLLVACVQLYRGIDPAKIKPAIDKMLDVADYIEEEIIGKENKSYVPDIKLSISGALEKVDRILDTNTSPLPKNYLSASSHKHFSECAF